MWAFLAEPYLDISECLRHPLRIVSQNLDSQKSCIQQENRRFFRPELDTLRFAAFLFVFIGHTLPKNIEDYGSLPGVFAQVLMLCQRIGGFGVDLFFLISSYLITELLRREQERFGTIDIKLFYFRRALRIWPLYFAYFAFGAFLGPLIFRVDSIGRYEMLSYLTFTNNWYIGIVGKVNNRLLSPLWSVSVEEQFYLVWPLLLIWFGFARVRTMVVVMLVVAVLTRAYLHAQYAIATAFWTNTFTRLDPIAVGALIAVTLKGRVPTFSRAIRSALFIGGLAVWLLGRGFSLNQIFMFPLASLGSTALLMSCLGVRQGSTIANRAFTYLGRISFGLYVFHQTGILITYNYLYLHGVYNELSSLVITIGLAATSYHFLERPFLLLKERLSRISSRPT